MRIRSASFAILFAFPFTIAVAQRGGRGGGFGRGGGGGGRGGERGVMQAPKFPDKSELGKFNPADLLLDKKKDLLLADGQIATLTTLRQSITDRNSALLTRYDSLYRDYKPETIPSHEIADPALEQAKVLRVLLDSLSIRRILDVSDALAVVTEEKSRQRAAELLAKQEEDYRSRLPQMGRNRR